MIDCENCKELICRDNETGSSQSLCYLITQRSCRSTHSVRLQGIRKKNLFAVFVQLTLDIFEGGCISCLGGFNKYSKTVSRLGYNSGKTVYIMKNLIWYNASGFDLIWYNCLFVVGIHFQLAKIQSAKSINEWNHKRILCIYFFEHVMPHEKGLGKGSETRKCPGALLCLSGEGLGGRKGEKKKRKR